MTTNNMENQPVPTESQQPIKASSNPFKKVVGYMQGQAQGAAKDRWEGSSYLSPKGKEPQQRYRMGGKKNKDQNSSEASQE